MIRITNRVAIRVLPLVGLLVGSVLSFFQALGLSRRARRGILSVPVPAKMPGRVLARALGMDDLLADDARTLPAGVRTTDPEALAA